MRVFEMLVVPEQEYPLVCVAVSQGSEPEQVVRFQTINLNSCSSWFTEISSGADDTQTFSSPLPHIQCSDGLCVHVIVGGNQVDAIHVTQLERDTVLVCLDSE